MIDFLREVFAGSAKRDLRFAYRGVLVNQFFSGRSHAWFQLFSGTFYVVFQLFSNRQKQARLRSFTTFV